MTNEVALFTPWTFSIQPENKLLLVRLKESRFGPHFLGQLRTKFRSCTYAVLSAPLGLLEENTSRAQHICSGGLPQDARTTEDVSYPSPASGLYLRQTRIPQKYPPPENRRGVHSPPECNNLSTVTCSKMCLRNALQPPPHQLPLLQSPHPTHSEAHLQSTVTPHAFPLPTPSAVSLAFPTDRPPYSRSVSTPPTVDRLRKVIQLSRIEKRKEKKTRSTLGVHD